MGPAKAGAEPPLLTSGNPAKRIIVFALPLLTGELLHLFYTMTDTYIVGRWLGIQGLASVGAGMSLIQFVWGFIIGMTAGFAVITTQRVGAAGGRAGGQSDSDGIRRSVAASLTLCLFWTLILTIPLLPLTRVILTAMRTPAEIIDDSAAYVLVIFAGTWVFMFYHMLSGILHAAGDSVSPLIFLVIGTAVNIVLDILFVAVFSWGVRGAAAATVISELAAAILTFCFLARRYPRFLPRKQDWRACRGELGAHLSLGISMALQRSIVEVGNILVQAAMNGLGSLTIAAVNAAQRVRGLNMLPVFAVARSVTTFTAQNYGAQKTERVYRGIFQACLISVGLGVFMAILNLFIGTPIASLFLGGNAQAVALARQYILFTGYTIFILGVMLVFRSALQGLGQKTAPILCGVMETVMSVLAAFVLIPRFGFTGVCLVNPLSWLASGIPLYIAFALYIRANNRQPRPRGC